MTRTNSGALVALVEIDERLDRRAQSEILANAYLASARGPVVVVLNCVSPLEADRMLDPVVRAIGNRVVGLIYVKHAQAETLRLIGPDTLVHTATDALRRPQCEHGIACTSDDVVTPMARSV